MSQYTESDFLNILKNNFGFNDFKNKEQKLAIESIVSEKYKDMIISMAANSGKSLCYLMPRYFRTSGVVLVISSHIARIANEIEFLTDLKIPATTITSETSYDDRDAIIQAFENSRNPFYFFYVTPEMIVKGSEKVRDLIDYLLQKKVCLVAVDEAQLLADFNFRESYQVLRTKRLQFPDVPWIALTTASSQTIEIIASSLSMNKPLIIKGSCVRNDIFLDAQFCFDMSNIIDIMADIIESDVKLEDATRKTYNSGIIYCEDYQHADKTADQLSKAGVPCKSYHLSKFDKDSILKNWKAGVFPILVTHEGAFNLGINRSYLKFVIFLTFPQSIRTFYQRSGKINVDGHARIIYTQPTGYVNFEVLDFLQNQSCRHQNIALKIGGEIVEPCRNKCDYCVSVYEMFLW